MSARQNESERGRGRQENLGLGAKLGGRCELASSLFHFASIIYTLRRRPTSSLSVCLPLILPLLSPSPSLPG